jgi:hypothetical protein
MNSYSTTSSFIAGGEPPIYMTFAKNLLAPALVGSIIDIMVTKAVGVQNCSFKDGETKCVLFDKSMPAIVRELLRVTIQMLVILFIVYTIQTSAVFNKEHLSIMGSAAFLICQSDLFEDFRRLINSLLFKIKYN